MWYRLSTVLRVGNRRLSASKGIREQWSSDVGQSIIEDAPSPPPPCPFPPPLPPPPASPLELMIRWAAAAATLSERSRLLPSACLPVWNDCSASRAASPFSRSACLGGFSPRRSSRSSGPSPATRCEEDLDYCCFGGGTAECSQGVSWFIHVCPVVVRGLCSNIFEIQRHFCGRSTFLVHSSSVNETTVVSKLAAVVIRRECVKYCPSSHLYASLDFLATRPA